MLHLFHYGCGSAVGIPNMFSVVILVLGVTTRVESGLYQYTNEIYHHQEPNYLPVAETVPHRGDLVNVEADKSVSYSISANDYNYLNLNKNGKQDAQYNSHNVLGGSAAVAGLSPCKKYLGGYHNIVSNEGVATTQNDFVNAHNPVYTPPVLQPIIKKHFYFHVPPPESEEKPVVVRPVQPPKKTYNILFIKAPSRQYSYASNLQDLLRNRQSNVEEKTIIYVLVKKPEPQPEVLVPDPPKTSEHEVFYVKYKDSLEEVAEQIMDSLGDSHADEVASVLNSAEVGHDAPLN